MNQSGHIIFVLGLYRNHIPPLTDGDDGLTQIFGHRRTGDNLLQTVPNLARLNTHVPADISQCRGCIICDLIFRQNCTENAVLQVFIWGQCGKERIQHSGLVVL